MSPFKAALFPFTFVSEALACASHARFGPTVVYQPAAGQTPAAMEKLAADGRIVLRFPVQGDELRLVQLAGNYRDWGEVYQKDAAAFAKISDTGFFHKEFAPEISTEIRRGPKPEAPAPDPVFQARLFLFLAQEYDRQTTELHSELAATDRAEQEMFSRIRGGPGQSDRFSEGNTGASKNPVKDPGAYMTESRLRAWHALMAADSDPPRLFVTPSRAVIEAVAEEDETLRKMDDPPEGLQIMSCQASGPDDGFKTEFYELGSRDRIIALLQPID
ncbi:MAG: hypothetical protein ACOCS6_00450 [Desulfosalsimonas sp.]